MRVRTTKSQKRAEQAAEDAKLAPARQAKVAALRLLLRDDELKWESCTREAYPSMYFSELVEDEHLAFIYTQGINTRFFARGGKNYPCHYEASKSQEGSFRVIIYLDNIDFSAQSAFLAQYREKLSSLCDRINTECEDLYSVAYEASSAKDRILPAIYAKVVQDDDSEDPVLLLPKIFSYLAAAIGLYQGDKRYDVREKQFIESHMKPVTAGAVTLIEMQFPQYLALLNLFDMANRMREKTIQDKSYIENITIFAFRKTTPPLPKWVSKIIANSGLLSWHDAVNLKEAVDIALAEKKAENANRRR